MLRPYQEKEPARSRRYKEGHDVSCPYKDETSATGGRRKLFDAVTVEENREISGSVDDSKNLHSIHPRSIKDENSFEAADPENSQSSKFGMLEPGFPSHLRVRGQQAKCFVRRQEKAVADFRACFRGQ